MTTAAPAAALDPATVPLAALDPGFRGELAWRQPRAARRWWLLLAGGTPWAALQNRGLLGSGWHLRTAAGAWRFPAHWLGNVPAFADGVAEPAARFRPGWWNNGRIERAGQPTLLWRRTSFWRGRWEIRSPEDLPLIRYHAQRRFLRLESTIELEDAARRLPDLEALLALGWILVLFERRGHSAAH